MKKSGEIIESIVRLLAQRETIRMLSEKRAGNPNNRRSAISYQMELLISLVDDLDAAKHLENNEARLAQNVKIGGSD